MSDQQVRLASLLLQEGFGEVVEKVASCLMRHGSSSLAEVIQNTELKPVQVRYPRAFCKKPSIIREIAIDNISPLIEL